MQRAGDKNSAQFTDSTHPHQSTDTPAALRRGDSLRLNSRPQVPTNHSPRDFTPRRAVPPPKHVKPSLSKHHTAPTSTGFVMEREGERKMYQSFAGVGEDGPGDTQPDSQIYKNWTSGVLESTSNVVAWNPSSLLNSVEWEKGVDTPTDHTEGVELVASSQEQGHSQTVTSPTINEEDELETQFRVNPVSTSPLKFETPAMAGRKRDSQGQILSSTMRTATTPGTTLTAAFFGAGNGGAGGHMMSLTQLFNATQAGTSPAMGAPSEDPVFQRPSPNFANGPRSSPMPAISSPTKLVRTDPPLRSSSEPRTEYVTMKQSQEQRERELQEINTTAPAQDSWDEPTEAEKRAAIRRAKEKYEREVGKSYASITAPPRFSPRSGGRRKKHTLLSSTPKYKTPAAVRTSRRATYDGLNEVGVSDDGMGSMDELSQPTPVNVDDDKDSTDELSPTIPTKLWAPATIKGDKNNADNKVQVPNTSSHPQRTFSGRYVHNSSPPESPSSQLHRESQIKASGSQSFRRGTSRFKRDGEPVTIADSQPDTTADPESVPRPQSLVLSSSPSTNAYRISQTILKKTGFTSQMVSSSQVPRPPSVSSSPVLGDIPEEENDKDEERVPSSPPVMTQEDDMVYDEHSGGEHEEENELEEPADEGVVTAGDDEVLETEEQEHRSDMHHEEDGLVRWSHPDNESDSPIQKPTREPRLQRQSTIPESDILEDTQPSIFAKTDVTRHDDTEMAESANREGVVLNQTNSTEPFFTAQEDQSLSQQKKSSGQASKKGEEVSSAKPRHFRSLTDIANQPETQRSTDIGDIEIPTLSFVDDMHNELSEIISGSSPARPPTKKRKIVYSAKKSKSFLSPFKESDPVSEKVPPSPLKQDQQIRENTPPSARKREEEGALAAAHAREGAAFAKPATLKTGRLSRPTKTGQLEKKGGLKPVNKSSLGKSTIKAKTSRISEFGETPIRSFEGPNTEEADVNTPDADDSPDELAPASTKSAKARRVAQDNNDRGESPTGPLLVPNRVLARWPGDLVFYPATCVGRHDQQHLSIRYDDGNVHLLEDAHVKAFDLKVGDLVKVDLPKMKKNAYVVVSFKDKINAGEGDEYPLTDRHGYTNIVLETKQKDSLPKASTKEPSHILTVPMANVYLTKSLWFKFRDRMYNFTPPASPSASASRIATPSDMPPTPSKSRRGTAGPSHLKESMHRAGSVASSAFTSNTFANMAFAITFTQDGSDKDAIANLIISNGGQVLEDGFHTLFQNMDSSDAPADDTKPGKSKANIKVKAKVDVGEDELVIKEEYRELGFVALISDEYSRRTKYVQALALNLPCLHYRWTTDSISSSRAVSFAKYLLPAGQSTYLNGAVRARTMELYDPAGEDAQFVDVISRRETLLSKHSVLLVVGKGRKEIERKKPYLFLTHALGPLTVGRCTDLSAAKKMIEKDDWDWIYVDGGERGVIEAGAALFGRATKSGSAKNGGAKRKKRKREDSVETEAVVGQGTISGKRVKIACDEFVVQSLILGALMEE
ncbi:hypothetical protein K469DRAFT_719069 [Zopfia rhizophila CBS 207.26]|uniref:BRCT domain-containing protein n=1 Tax=Zopfia rhizophila CBS 207.26 TaxID=1314779 RepID=A0A6A6ELS0_9PEZI|nr:hypothetical protein K469DRAFT_719069 [Zopfia rhizophila CBS 207.26]